jgi:cell wall-associated NlpC family hydrolase
VAKLAAAFGLLLALGAVALGGCVAAVSGAVAGSDTGSSSALGRTTGDGDPAVPAEWEALARAAASTCSGLPWALLAAIGRVESDSGRSTAAGVQSGANAAGAEGPMQFEPSTFAAYATVGPGGAQPPSPYDPVDAVYSAAHLLCVNGAATRSGLAPAVWDYNHSTVYVGVVLALATALDDDPTATSGAASAIAFAAEQLGAPYLWGGTGPGGWDCSGLVQAAYRSAGVTLPRVAQDQFDAGPQLAAGVTVAPGDLVFFGPSTSLVDHVGLYLGDGEMIDAPHTGAVVREEPAAWPDLVGATRPT